MQSRLLYLFLVIILAVSALLLIKRDQNIVKLTPKVATLIGGEFNLLNQNSKPISEKNILGSYALIFFGFTYCPDVCPTVLQTISTVLDSLEKETMNILPIFISIDPKRDTPEVLKSYLENFHPHIMGLTGSTEQVKSVAKAYGVYYAKARENEVSDLDYLMDHSGGIYLMGPDGLFITKFPHSSTPEEILDKIMNFL